MFSPPVSSGKNGPTSLASGHFTGSSTYPLCSARGCDAPCYFSVGITFVVVVVISSGAQIHSDRSGILPVITPTIPIAVSTRRFRSLSI